MKAFRLKSPVRKNYIQSDELSLTKFLLEKFKNEIKPEYGNTNIEDRNRNYGLYGLCNDIHFIISKPALDSKKIAEYAEGTYAKKSVALNGLEMSEEITIDKEFMIQELKMINIKNWQNIVSESVIHNFQDVELIISGVLH